jgi:hypothetical protein
MRSLLTGLLIFLLFPAFAQKMQRSAGNQHTLQWEQPQVMKLSDQLTVRALYFKGAVYDLPETRLPVFRQRTKTPAGTTSANASLIDAVYQPLTQEELNIGTTILPSETSVTTTIGYENKQPFALIEIKPFRENPSTGQYEKLVSFGLSISYQDGKRMNSSLSAQSQTYASSSVLAQGDWYKIGVTRDGIYKLTPAFLRSMGIDVEAINPQNIRIYGNGGRQLPYLAGASRRDDLAENAIYVAGESDNVLNENDYVLFYGESPNTWQPDTDNVFHHNVHQFSDTTYYFLTIGATAGKRISVQGSAAGANVTVSSFDDYAYHENDLVNLLKTGREWYGESFEVVSSYTIPFSFPNIDASSPALAKVRLASRLTSGAMHYYNTSIGSATMSFPVSGTSAHYTDTYAYIGEGDLSFTPSGPFSVTVSKGINANNASAWLDYVEVNVRRLLSMSGDQMLFRDTRSVAAGNVAQYNLSNAGSNVTVWEVTDPANVKQQAASLNGNTLQFAAATDSLRSFIAFTGGSFLTPSSSGRVANQNLHALTIPDMIIVSHPSFLAQANTLADLHREKDTLDVLIVTPQEIYNEFSSGMQDASAIRNFVKMFYDRAASPADQPKYLLLFGDGSYDNKRRFNPNSNYIPTYESANSTSPISSFVSDDYFACLDDSEGNMIPSEFADIGVGRFPVRNTGEAQAVVNKVIRYTEQDPNAMQNSSACAEQGSTTVFGDWRNVVCFIADDEDYSAYISSAEQLATFIDTTYNNYNIDKIYMDAYQQVSTPGGQRYPDATDAFVKRVEKGALIVNYIGHGGEVGLAHERLLEISNINNWRNLPRLPLFLTATCEFSRYDDPERTSAGEYALLNPDGGAIAMLTTVRLVYNWDNIALCTEFYNSAFQEQPDGKMPSLGDLMKIIKSDANGTSVNGRKFALLGDPALTLAYPKHVVVTDSINGNAITSSSMDTLRALSLVKIAGHVRDKNGNVLNSYNGILHPTVFEKTSIISNLSNDGPGSSPVTPFKLQKNIIYKGKVSVTNGKFSFSFVVPKDISFQYGTGRISYYLQNGVEDGSGYCEQVIVGGSDAASINDNAGPEVQLYLNDSNFVQGGITNEDPDLFAKIKDGSGINTVGTGIGHDITAVLDENTEDAVVLNDYYEADLNSYKSGIVRYPFSELSEGTHKLSIRVWDVYNNSAQAYTEFVVSESAKLALSHVLNYPNPFTTKTQFYFEHNRCCDLMDVQIQIFTVSGKLVKTIQTLVNSEGFRSNPIEWDGKDDYGDQIGRGVYIYRVKVKSSMGDMADAFEKLVILN